ncbi:MAG: sugar ABC transporter permease [Caldilineaceae bacterium]
MVSRQQVTKPAAKPAKLHWGHSPLPYVLPTVLYLLALTVYPLFYSLYLSFQNYTPQTNAFHFVGLANYLELVTDPLFLASFRNTLLFTLVVTLVELLLGLLIALFFERDFFGKAFLRTALIIPMLSTPMVVGLIWRFLLNADWGVMNWLLHFVGIGPINWVGQSPWALISLMLVDIWQWTGFAFLMLYAGLQTLPEEIFEAAKVDGANAWQRFWDIKLPLLRPLIIILTIFRSVDAFRSFDTVFALTYGGPGNSSYLLSFYAYLAGFSFLRMGYASAIAYVMVIFVIVATTLMFRVLHRMGSEL